MKKSYYDTPLWNSSLSEEERLKYLLKQLTLEEKFACLGTGCPAIERLGIPEFFVGGEGAHGVQARNDQSCEVGETVYTTILPNPIGMSATWDEELIKKAGAMVGNEARGLYQTGKHRSLSLWAPTVDMERDPRWGRTEEGYGEDPYLTGRMAGAYVEGLQGDDAYYLRCAATLKHYYANNTEEGRTYLSNSVDLRNKQEYYLAPFRRLIREHHAEGLMTAYNEINGIPCMLLKEDIRLAKRWGVGHVVCDGGDFSQTVDFHKYFSRHSETIAAGLDAEIDCFTDNALMVSAAAREAYERKIITIEQIDGALWNHFRVMLRLGLFDCAGRNPYKRIGMEVVGTKENHELVRKVTAESVVLLKNSGVLPLSKERVRQGEERLAVVGPLSNVWFKDWYSGIPPYRVTPLEGIYQALFGESADIADYMLSKLFKNDADAADNECQSFVYDKAEFVAGVCRRMKNVEFEDGVSVVRLRLEDGKEHYLGILSDGETVGAVTEERAECFRIDFWENDKITLRAESNGLLLTTEDDESIGQDGRVRAKKEEAFGWFVRELFYLRGDGSLQTWDKQDLQIDEDGILRKKHKVEEKLVVEILYEKDGIEEAAEAVKNANKVLLFLGSNPMITCKEEIDRENIALPEYQEKMLRRICQENDNVILVLVSSVPYDISWAKEYAAGIMVCATGSMELGNGLADIIFGKESPAGRLNMTWYFSTAKLPPITDYDIIQGGRTYQYYEGEVLYPFGYGLTYSQIEYRNLSVELSDFTHLLISLTVLNKGQIATDEVVQIYYHKLDSVVKRAKRTLIAFDRVKALRPGETRKVAFRVSLEELKYYDVISEEMLLEPGEYQIQAGCSSAQILLQETIYLSGTARGLRNGHRVNKAECFDSAKNHVLHSGHLGYTSVCTKNGTDVIELSYEKMYLEEHVSGILLDFWQEHPCHIWMEVNGNTVGECQVGNSVQSENKQQEDGKANGVGASEAHQNWIIQRREIGFAELLISLENVPVQKEFTLTIKWQGKGKLCTYQFCS